MCVLHSLCSVHLLDEVSGRIVVGDLVFRPVVHEEGQAGRVVFVELIQEVGSAIEHVRKSVGW